MNAEAEVRYPLFTLVISLAAHKQARQGKISQQRCDTVHDTIVHPLRKNAAGETCDLIDALHDKVVWMAATDSALCGEYGLTAEALAATTFNWSGIIAWIEANLPAILSVLEALIAAFFLFA